MLTPIFDCIRESACRCAAMRLAIIFSLLFLSALKLPLAAVLLWDCPHFFILIFHCINEAAGRSAALRFALIFSLIYLTVLKMPLVALPLWDYHSFFHYEVRPQFFTVILNCFKESAGRYDIRHLFTPIFDCIKDAAGRFVARWLPLTFSFEYFTVSKKLLAAVPLWD